MYSADRCDPADAVVAGRRPGLTGNTLFEVAKTLDVLGHDLKAGVLGAITRRPLPLAQPSADRDDRAVGHRAGSRGEGAEGHDLHGQRAPVIPVPAAPRDSQLQGAELESGA
jgi:hypothetical protein